MIPMMRNFTISKSGKCKYCNRFRRQRIKIKVVVEVPLRKAWWAETTVKLIIKKEAKQEVYRSKPMVCGLCKRMQKKITETNRSPSIS